MVTRFGVPAAVGAILGAGTLTLFHRLPVLAGYTIGGANLEITVVKAAIGTLIVIFALLELSPRFQALALSPRWLPAGGALSGFFGGLSGNQGVLRSAFLLNAGLSKEGFVATGVVSAVIVDVVRLTVYGTAIFGRQFEQAQTLFLQITVGTIGAFVGAFVGKRVLQKITLRAVQIIVVIAMLAIGTGLATGLLGFVFFNHGHHISYFFSIHYGWPIQVSRLFVLLDIISCTVPATMC